jgi:hypothetical protein
VAIIVCNSTVTGTIKIDAVSANFSSGIMEQDECASTIGKLVDLGLNQIFSNSLASANRLQYSFTDFRTCPTCSLRD